MRKTRDDFKALHNLIKTLEIHKKTLDKIQTFDYDSFAKSNKIFSKELFARVVHFMRTGNLKEMYLFPANNIDQTIKIAKRINQTLEKGKFPNREDLWLLNQDYTQTKLYGQYIAQIFDMIDSEISTRIEND
jgi:hypothetical protein